MDHKMYMKVSTAIFTVVAIVHAVRVYQGWGVMIGPYAIPVWASIAGVLVAGFLAWTGYKMIR